jgi:hypothetical protein
MEQSTAAASVPPEDAPAEEDAGAVRRTSGGAPLHPRQFERNGSSSPGPVFPIRGKRGWKHQAFDGQLGHATVGQNNGKPRRGIGSES